MPTNLTGDIQYADPFWLNTKYPLVMTDSLLRKPWPIEIDDKHPDDDLAIDSLVFFQFAKGLSQTPWEESITFHQDAGVQRMIGRQHLTIGHLKNRKIWPMVLVVKKTFIYRIVFLFKRYSWFVSCVVHGKIPSCFMVKP
jgi:hypothetical protein